jgi:hypothetical protein
MAILFKMRWTFTQQSNLLIDHAFFNLDEPDSFSASVKKKAIVAFGW